MVQFIKKKPCPHGSAGGRARVDVVWMYVSQSYVFREDQRLRKNAAGRGRVRQARGPISTIYLFYLPAEGERVFGGDGGDTKLHSGVPGIPSLYE